MRARPLLHAPPGVSSSMRVDRWPLSIALAVCAAVAPGCARIEPGSQDELDRLERGLPRARVRSVGGLPARIHGTPLATGDSAAASAATFVRERARALGAEARDLRVERSPSMQAQDPARAGGLPLMHDPHNGRPRFTLVRYAQQRGGVPVHGARLALLVRQESEHPLVLAASTLKDLGEFEPGYVVLSPVRADLANVAIQGAHGRGDFTGRPLAPPAQLTRFSEPEPVIWAGAAAQPEPPRLAMRYVGENADGSSPARRERWRFVADARSGAILLAESLVHYDVAGDVGGRATLGPNAAECVAESRVPFRDAQVSLQGAGSTFADDTGAFVFDHDGMSSVMLESRVRGQHFQVLDAVPARDAVLTTSVVPPGPASFTHNDANTSEASRAQANAYVHASLVRDWVLDVHPSFPDVVGQRGFPIHVNRTDDICPGNAWYDGSSLSFCLSFDDPAAMMPDFANSAFGSVIYHEYGHHLVEVGGSGQVEYGEGMADVVAMLMTDDPRMGLGFFMGDCASDLRTADNACQYAAGAACSSCGFEAHDCGRLLSGAFWDLREAIGRDATAALALSSILLHSGTAIDAQITIDVLTLDDDDANLDNGTPNGEAICAAFGAHGLGCPSDASGLTASPDQPRLLEGPAGGPFAPAGTSYVVENLGPGTLGYTATTGAAWLDVMAGSGSLAAGATATVSFDTNAAAAALAPGVHTATVTFTNTTTGVGNTTRAITLRIGYDRIYQWDLSTNPGWSTEGAWAWGVPSGGGGTLGDDNYGSPDPTSGYTGANVYGYALSGNYDNDLDPPDDLTTGAIDCSGLSHVTLAFQRWLGVENAIYDVAQVQVNPGLGPTGWRTVWENAQTLNGGYWSRQEIDITEHAAFEPTLRVRWRMGPTDGGWRYAGWNLDDIEVWGIRAPDCSDDAECDDGVFCNGVEACVAGACTAGEALDCDDGVGCTVDACDETEDGCDHAPGHDACDDGAFCNGSEVCDLLLDCQAGADPCAGAGCDEAVDACEEPEPLDAGVDAGDAGGDEPSDDEPDDPDEPVDDDDPESDPDDGAAGESAAGGRGITGGGSGTGGAGSGGSTGGRGLGSVGGAGSESLRPVVDVGDHEQAPGEPDAGPAPKAKSDSGCAVSSVRGSAPSAPLALLALIASALLLRRKRAVARAWGSF